MNIDLLFNAVSKKSIKKYIFYYLSYLFSQNDYNEYVNFIEKYILEIISFKGEKLIQSLLNILKDNFKDFYLCIDNIKTKEEFDIVNIFVGTCNINFEAFIEINKNTIDCLKDINYQLIYNVTENNDVSNDMEYYLPLTFREITKEKIKEIISEKLKFYFKNIDYEGYRYLLKIKHFLNSNDFEIIDLKDYASFLEFLLLSRGQKKIY